MAAYAAGNLVPQSLPFRFRVRPGNRNPLLELNMTTRTTFPRENGQSDRTDFRPAQGSFHPWMLIRILLLALFCCAASVCAHAQTSYGSIVGTVTDPTGANVVGAKVTLENHGTNATQTSISGNGGTYSFINLNPGSYK